MRSWVLPACLLPLGAAGEIYRWTDASGQVHFGERPSAGAERVEVRPQVIERDAATRERERSAERFFDARRQEQAQADQLARQQRAERERECQALQARAQHLSRPGRYFFTDEQGERVYYSDGQLLAARQQLTRRIEQSCR